MVKESFTPFGTLVPNTPSKALFWINSIIFIIAFFKKPVVLEPIDLIMVSLTGMVFSVYLWYKEMTYYHFTQVRFSISDVWSMFMKEVKYPLILYGSILVIYFLIRTFVIR